MQVSIYLAGHTANPLPQVKVVGALVQKNAAAFTVPSGTPCTGIVVVLTAIPIGNNPVGTFDLTQSAAFYQFFHFAIHGSGALVKHNTEFFVAFCGNFVHFTNGFGVNPCGFFTHHMITGLQAFNNQPGMVVVRGGNQNSVANVSGKQFVGGGEALYFGMFFTHPVQTSGIDVASGNKFHFGNQTFG